MHEVAEAAPSPGEREGALARKANETIARVTDDVLRRFQFHTPIAALMELVNELGGSVDAPDARFAAETAVSLIQPYAPHVAEELWTVLGHERLWEAPWPEADEAQLVRETFELVVQVNGKVRDRFEVDAALSEDELVARARESRARADATSTAASRARRSSSRASSSTSWSKRAWRNQAESSAHAARPLSGVLSRSNSSAIRAPCVLVSERPSHADDERLSAKPSYALARMRPVDVPVAADAREPAHVVLVLLRREQEAADHALAALEVAVEDVDGRSRCGASTARRASR